LNGWVIVPTPANLALPNVIVSSVVAQAWP
jgi:hypothetical protein